MNNQHTHSELENLFSKKERKQERKIFHNLFVARVSIIIIIKCHYHYDDKTHESPFGAHTDITAHTFFIFLENKNFI